MKTTKTVKNYKTGHDFCVYNKETMEIISYHKNAFRAIEKSEKLTVANRNICWGTYRADKKRYFGNAEYAQAAWSC
jgi:hypothetical protein